MPIYEYACGKCQREFEVEQRITDEPLKTCPKCRSRRVKRLISQTSFVLKGSGWYSDLYASSKKTDGKEASGGDAGEAKTGSGSESASESKAEKSDSEASPASEKSGASSKKGRKGKGSRAAA